MIQIPLKAIAFLVYTLALLAGAFGISYAVFEWRDEEVRPGDIAHTEGFGLVHAKWVPCEEIGISTDCPAGEVMLPVYDPGLPTREAKKAAIWATHFTTCILQAAVRLAAQGDSTMASIEASRSSCSNIANTQSGLMVP